MPDTLIRIAAAVLAVVFGWAAVAKLVRYRSWVTALAGYELPAPLARIAAVGAPLAEIVAAGLLVAGRTLMGASLALALLAVFSLAIVRAHARHGDRLPCGCFGRTRSRDFRLMLVRNAALTMCAAVVLLGREDLSPITGLEPPSRATIVPIGLAVVGCMLIAWIVAAAIPTYRQRGSR